MTTPLQCESWVLITDSSDEVATSLTAQQLRVLSQRGCETIKTVDCATENAPEKICGSNGVHSFPTMCNVQTNSCLSGVNETDAHFNGE